MADDLQDTRAAQRGHARGLGFAGATVVPILLALALVFPELAAFSKQASLYYGAAILSFLGGIHWGIALWWEMPKIALRRMWVSMIPPLWAVASLNLPAAWCAVMLVAGLFTLLIYEWVERGDATYPAWYLPLRLQLTTLLALGLGMTLLV